MLLPKCRASNQNQDVISIRCQSGVKHEKNPSALFQVLLLWFFYVNMLSTLAKSASLTAATLVLLATAMLAQISACARCLLLWFLKALCSRAIFPLLGTIKMKTDSCEKASDRGGFYKADVRLKISVIQPSRRVNRSVKHTHKHTWGYTPVTTLLEKPQKNMSCRHGGETCPQPCVSVSL